MERQTMPIVRNNITHVDFTLRAVLNVLSLLCHVCGVTYVRSFATSTDADDALALYEQNDRACKTCRAATPPCDTCGEPMHLDETVYGCDTDHALEARLVAQGYDLDELERDNPYNGLN